MLTSITVREDGIYMPCLRCSTEAFFATATVYAAIPRTTVVDVNLAVRLTSGDARAAAFAICSKGIRPTKIAVFSAD